jgi:hypothetical protein
MTWPLLPVVMAGALAAAIGVAWLLKFSFVHGWYLIILSAGIGGAVLGGVLFALVGWSRCRNPWLAGSLGVVAGLVAYVGYYQLCLADFLPPGGVGRVDLLPRYIQLRMATDVQKQVGEAQLQGQPKKPFVAWNWITFGIELLLVTGAAAALGWARARRVYCAELGKWMRQESALLPPQAGPGFREALEAGTLPEVVAATPPGGDPQKACRLTLEYADPNDGSPLDYPVYVSLNDPGGARRRLGGRKALRQVELEPAEVLALRPLFPQLGRLLELKHEQLRDLPAEVLVAPVEEAPAVELAEITPVPEPYRQRVRSKGYAVALNLRGLIPLVFFLGGAGLAAWGIWQMTQGSLALGGAAFVAGAAAFAWGVYTALYCLGVYENRWVNRRLRREFAQRSDALVSPDDPEAIYVSIIPRDSFVKVKWTMASDVLLFKLDERRRQLLLEGDADRYRIPAGAIAVCEPQCFFHPIDTQRKNEFWLVRLVVHVEQGSRELLLGPNHTDFKPMTNARRRFRAEEWCQRINALLGQAGPEG